MQSSCEDNSREGHLKVIGFDAAYVVWSGRIQSLHQHLQRVTKLQERIIIITITIIINIIIFVPFVAPN